MATIATANNNSNHLIEFRKILQELTDKVNNKQELSQVLSKLDILARILKDFKNFYPLEHEIYRFKFKILNLQKRIQELGGDDVGRNGAQRQRNDHKLFIMAPSGLGLCIFWGIILAGLLFSNNGWALIGEIIDILRTAAITPQ